MAYRVRRVDMTAQLDSATRLEDAMRAADLNGRQLADAARISQTYMSLIRRGGAGHVSRDVASDIEQALGVRHGELFSYAEQAQS